MKLKFLSSIAVLMLFGATANAATSSSILMDIVPANPAPFEDTTITLSSYSDNLDIVQITWLQDGKNVSSGIGKKTFAFRAPAALSTTTVSATVALPGGSVKTSVTIKPSVMVLLWQANDSYVPPFYRGKALPALGSEIKIVAMPEVRGVSPKNMTYSWKKDYTPDQEGSGYGKNFFIYTNDYLENSNTIGVVALTTDQKNSSEASINVGATQPRIVFYKNDKTLGTIWEHALPNPYKLTEPEIIEAVPYFISPKEIQNPALIWNWFINGNLVRTQGAKKHLMPLQAESGASGISKLKLIIENQYKIFGTASKEINIEF